MHYLQEPQAPCLMRTVVLYELPRSDADLGERAWCLCSRCRAFSFGIFCILLFSCLWYHMSYSLETRNVPTRGFSSCVWALGVIFSDFNVVLISVIGNCARQFKTKVYYFKLVSFFGTCRIVSTKDNLCWSVGFRAMSTIIRHIRQSITGLLTHHKIWQ